MLRLQKYGGSSVADLGSIARCAERCVAAAAGGDRLVVVVSAMAGETNRLIALANALTEPGPPAPTQGPYVHAVTRDADHARELDQLVSTGETVSAALMAMAIARHGGASVSLVGPQLGLRTDRNFMRSRVSHVECERIERELSAGKIVVCAGFQGVDGAGDTTTLGRGGSDTSAVAFAAALGADVCEILTDVDGVFTSDPRIVPDARKIDRLSYDEMLELASLGAKVLHTRSVAFAKRFGVRVHVRSSHNHGEGTWIMAADETMEGIVVSGVALERNEAKVTMVGIPDVPGMIARVFVTLGEAGIVVDMIIQNSSRQGHTDITFTVAEADRARAVAVLEPMDFGDGSVAIETDPAICKISIVGLGMRSNADVAARAFRLLAGEGINVQMVSNSEIKMSIIVHERYGELALRVLHAGFGLDAPSEAGG